MAMDFRETAIRLDEMAMDFMGHHWRRTTLLVTVFFKFLSDPSPIIDLPCQSVSHLFTFWQATYPCHILQNRAKPNICWRQSFLEIMKLCIDAGTKQKSCYWCWKQYKSRVVWCRNKTKVMLVMQKQNKSHLPWWQKMICPIFSLFQTSLGRFFVIKIFIRHKPDHCLALSVSESVSFSSF